MIYENIVKLCKEKNISIKKLEEECGLGNATIKGWSTCSPTVTKVQKVADYFGVTILDLLKEDGG